MAILRGSESSTSPLCLPYELARGRWSRGIAKEEVKIADNVLPPLHFESRLPSDDVAGRTWQLFSECRVKPKEELLSVLRAQRAAIVVSGNSVLRHLYFELASYLRGVDGGSYGLEARKLEMQMCSKEPPATLNNRTFGDRWCKTGCCGACSCMTEVDGVSIYFVWQQGWFDESIRVAWDYLLFGEQAQRHGRIYFSMNAGLVHAKYAEGSMKMVQMQIEPLRKYLQQLPDNVAPIYHLSTATQNSVQDPILAAQDAMVADYFDAMPPQRRPLIFDTRMLTAKWVDFIDAHHYGGHTADITVAMWAHLMIAWDELHEPGGRGDEYARGLTRHVATTAYLPNATRTAALHAIAGVRRLQQSMATDMVSSFTKLFLDDNESPTTRLAAKFKFPHHVENQSAVCWTHHTAVNLGMPDVVQPNKRCALRHETLKAAQVACLSHTWCGGITRDNGIRCGQAQMRFELRSSKRQAGTPSVLSYVLVNKTRRECRAQHTPPAAPQHKTSGAKSHHPKAASNSKDDESQPAMETANDCTGGRCRVTFRDVFFVVITGQAMHHSRCRLIKHGYASLLPPGHLVFYSDADDPSLPAVRVLSPMPAGQNVRTWSQRKWIPALIDAYNRIETLGTKWTMVADDDTYVQPRNLLRVLESYNPMRRVLVGQKCGPIDGTGARALCGGAGWAMTTPVHRLLVSQLPKCEKRYFAQSIKWHVADRSRIESQSDRFLSRCFWHELNISITDRAEFNSQPPLFYETKLGHGDRPRGYSKPATFHYLSTRRHAELMKEMTDETLWHNLEHQVGVGRRLSVAEASVERELLVFW